TDLSTVSLHDALPIFSFDDGLVFAFNPPAFRGLGTAGGFEVYVQARSDPDPQRLAQIVQTFTQALSQHPDLTAINTFYRPTVPRSEEHTSELQSRENL